MATSRATASSTEAPTWRTQPAIAGAAAGLAGGVVFGLMMTMMSAPTPDGGTMPMMAMVGMVVRSPSVLVGWVYHLFN
ncbi:MAG: hypothetical protein ACRDI2_24065, partial [Chloroflexota bacterium]